MAFSKFLRFEQYYAPVFVQFYYCFNFFLPEGFLCWKRFIFVEITIFPAVAFCPRKLYNGKKCITQLTFDKLRKLLQRSSLWKACVLVF